MTFTIGPVEAQIPPHLAATIIKKLHGDTRYDSARAQSPVSAGWTTKQDWMSLLTGALFPRTMEGWTTQPCSSQPGPRCWHGEAPRSRPGKPRKNKSFKVRAYVR